jgi:hypothetical protein
MSGPLLLHVMRADTVPDRCRRLGLVVVEHANAVTVSCPECTERQDYYRDRVAGWRGAAFLHDVGCPLFARRQAALSGAKPV